MKSHSRSHLYTTVTSFLAAKFLALLGWSVRIKIVASDLDRSQLNHNSGCLLAFWHNQQIPAIWIHHRIYELLGNRPIHALISRHNDGRLAANVIKHYGVNSVDGSSSAGGTQAMLKMRELLSQRVTVAITPDGPRGPKHKAKRGIAKLALTTNAPIYCCAVAEDCAWYFKSWDRMFLPKPFSKIVIVFNKFDFDRSNTAVTQQNKPEGQLAEQLTDHLDRLTAQAKSILSELKSQ